MAETENQRKFYKIIMVVNVLILSAFLIINTLTHLSNMSIESIIVYFVAGEAFLILVNFLVYRYFSKRNQA